MSKPDNPADNGDPAELRAEIDRLRTRHERELERLHDELEGLRQQGDPDRDADTVTDSLALQQEVDTLRHALREKDRMVDYTSGQCRRLEDELEDQSLSYEVLKQDLERKETSLAAAREQMARLSRELKTLDERCRAGESPRSGEVPAQPGGAPLESSPAAPRTVTFAIGGGFLAGLIVGVLTAVVSTLAILRPGSLAPAGAAPSTREGAAAGAASPPAAFVEDDARAEAPLSDDTQGAIPRQDAAPTLSDFLRNGARGPLLVAVEGARFTMGKARALPGDDQGPAREVRVAAFLIGVTEVTFDEYDPFARATGRRLPDDFGWGRGRRPVVDVRWEDASAYADWLSLQSGKRYRLPSEAEWEYAASAGRRTPFWWGYQVGEGRAVCFDCGSAWDKRSTAPVGSFDPNPFGLYDTAGNAMEWVADCYHPSYAGAPDDATPWTRVNCRDRVARGGAFNKPARSMRNTERHRFDADTRLNMLGFRVARDG